MYTVNEILEKEEEKYYPILKSIVEKNRRPLFNEGYQTRLEIEIEIIHRIKQSKVVWFCYEIIEEAKRKNEPYLIRGPIADLYLLYLLKITKFNPIETNCCFEACLGIMSKPKTSI